MIFFIFFFFSPFLGPEQENLSVELFRAFPTFPAFKMKNDEKLGFHKLVVQFPEHVSQKISPPLLSLAKNIANFIAENFCGLRNARTFSAI